MDRRRARELVANERKRVEAAIRDLTGAVTAEGDVQGQQTGESDSGSELATEMTEVALVEDLRQRLAAVARAEGRIAAGTFGRSVESGALIPDARLDADPLAERTIDEQRRFDQDAR
jgi:DnaK suppressor protein